MTTSGQSRQNAQQSFPPPQPQVGKSETSPSNVSHSSWRETYEEGIPGIVIDKDAEDKKNREGDRDESISIFDDLPKSGKPVARIEDLPRCLGQSVEEWNRWRQKYPAMRLDLAESLLS